MAKEQNKQTSHSRRVAPERIRKIVKSSDSVIHFIGVGGISMSALARLTLEYGCTVTGSDRGSFAMLGELISLGASIRIGHDPSYVEGATLVVYSHAIGEDEAEILRAQELQIPTVNRAEYLGALMLDYSHRIGVSGTHGKSTTTAMLERIFTAAGTDPTVLSGAGLSSGASQMRLGGQSTLIYEACEYRDSFLRFSPTIAIALNLELDHTDYFKNLAELKESFRRALSHATAFAVVNSDDSNLSRIINGIKTRVVTFGQRATADYRYHITAFKSVGYEFDITKYGNVIGTFELNIPGTYNVTNAVAAIVTALEFGIDIGTVQGAISAFSGIPRRLEHIGENHLRPVYYDYAHHPTAIACAINTVKMMTHGEVTVIFKPHTYSRTQSLWEDFKLALSLADRVIITDIYPAREAAIEGITSERLAQEIGDHAVYAPDDEVVRELHFNTTGAIIIMGAGDMEDIKDAVLKHVI